MKCYLLFSEKTKLYISQCRVLKILTSMLRFKNRVRKSQNFSSDGLSVVLFIVFIECSSHRRQNQRPHNPYFKDYMLPSR